MQYGRRESCLFFENAEAKVPENTSSYPVGDWLVQQGQLEGECYHTISAGAVLSFSSTQSRGLIQAVAALLQTHLVGAERILVCGLGNGALAADRLGTVVCQQLTSIPGQARRLYSIVPGVPAQTGIPTDKLVAMAAEVVRAERIVAVDALCAKGADSLGTVLQLSNTGLVPGSGLCVHGETKGNIDGFDQTKANVEDVGDPVQAKANVRAMDDGDTVSGEISTRTMPCPVVLMGVPTVIRTTLPMGGSTRYLVMPGDIDRVVERWGLLLAAALRRALLSP